MITIEERLIIDDLYAAYAAALDDNRLDDWLDLFAQECSYRIIPRDNADLGLPLALVLCESRAMLLDRVLALREANEYSIHTDRHLYSGVRIRGREGDVAHVEASFAMFQTSGEGDSELYAVGKYRDEVLLRNRNGHGRFRSKTIILDTFCVPHAVSTLI